MFLAVIASTFYEIYSGSTIDVCERRQVFQPAGLVAENTEANLHSALGKELRIGSTICAEFKNLVARCASLIVR